MSTTLPEQIKEKTPVECLVSRGGLIVQFQWDEHHVRSFATGYFLHSTWEPNPDFGRVAQAPTEKLTLSFTTADVTITGWRLDRVMEPFSEGKLSRVKVMPDAARYQPLLPAFQCVVATIEIKDVEK